MSKLDQPVTDDTWSSDEDDSDFVPEADQEGDHDISDDNEDEITEAAVSKSKRKLGVDDKEKQENDNKRARNETERKAKVDALWAEMNVKPSAKSGQQPLNDISPPVNQQTSTTDGSEAKLKASSSATTSSSTEQQQQTTRTTTTTKRMQRPKSNLSDLVSQYNIKVPKMNTLEKSRLDWQGYVEREGIKDDLKYTNKDGYMEKVAFLQRVDDRRLNDLKHGQKQSKK
ncbi:hypothetical protein [Absidia glauca]|uniref:SWR1-complex protein 5 n=1 Tax=Absidia glauca TaxID=4829 RepID=A0A168L7I7_ABSGL|nr:hypothetical protein [Absidia glauca]